MDAYRAAVKAPEGAEVAAAATEAYRNLAGYLFVKFMDGNREETDENGNFIRVNTTCRYILNSPGYNDKRYYENIVRGGRRSLSGEITPPLILRIPIPRGISVDK